MRTYRLTERVDSDAIRFGCTITYEDKRNFNIGDLLALSAFEWLTRELKHYAPCQVVIIGCLGQDVNRMVTTALTPDKAVRQIWKSWFTQALQARSSTFRQKVILER